MRVHEQEEVQAALRVTRNADNALMLAVDADRGEARKVATKLVTHLGKQLNRMRPMPEAAAK